MGERCDKERGLTAQTQKKGPLSKIGAAIWQHPLRFDQIKKVRILHITSPGGAFLKS